MEIKDIQELLTEAGYFKGAVNGKLSLSLGTAIAKIVERNHSKLYGNPVNWSEDRFHIAAGQIVLRAMGYLPGNIDGIPGPKTALALAQWRDLKNKPAKPTMPADSTADPALVSGVNPKFDKESAARVKKCLPPMRALLNAARDEIEFYVSQSTRGKKEQEDAFRRGASKAHFGQSAHNYDPPIAVDLWPKKNVDWNDIKAFKAIQKVIGWFNPKTKKGAGLAKKLGIPTRWGGDWNMDGSDADGWDLPHYELHPWRDWAKQSKLYQG